MDDIPFGKVRIILLPILLGLIIIFFLKLCSIKISFWILIVLLIAILLASKLPTISLKTILPGLLMLVVVISILLFILEAGSYIVGLGSENFYDDVTMKDYEYKGNFVIQDESLKILGTATIFNSDASDDFLWIPLYWVHPDFDIFGVGRGTMKITMDNGDQIYSEEIHFDKSNSFKIDFGAGARHEREDEVYFKVNGISSTINKPPIYFDTDRPYSVKVDFTGAFNVFEINIGE